MKLTGVVNMTKQDQILDQAMLEFAQKGFENASTNSISKAAKLSKGLIFHYYPNKEDLFAATIEEALRRMNHDIQVSLVYQSKDLFERFSELMSYKTLLLLHPDPAVTFITTLSLDVDHRLRDQVRSMQERFNGRLYQQLFEGLDLTGYRTDFSLQEMMEISLVVLQQVGQQLIQPGITPEQLQQQLEDAMQPWINRLKRLFFKGERHD
jgi:TetR/AcrR family transcriptional regulator